MTHMPKLVIGISATCVFDMHDIDQAFQTAAKVCVSSAVQEYRDLMRSHEDEQLKPGTAMPLIQSIIRLNTHCGLEQSPIELVIISRNSIDSGIRVLKSLRANGMAIQRFAFTAGDDVVPYVKAFGVDLFLTTNNADAQALIDQGICAAAVLRAPPESAAASESEPLCIAFDGDAVIFDESSELIFKEQGLVAFQAHENDHQQDPIPRGPFAHFLEKLSGLQKALPLINGKPLVRIALVTARGFPAEMRVINTLRHWGVAVDQSFFLSGFEKSAILAALKPHIFFDDQDRHLELASTHTPAGKVPYPSFSKLSARSQA